MVIQIKLVVVNIGSINKTITLQVHHMHVFVNLFAVTTLYRGHKHPKTNFFFYIFSLFSLFIFLFDVRAP